MYAEVLSFWFEEIDTESWFASDKNFDELIRRRFLSVMQQAAVAELHTWRAKAVGRLAEIIVLDQFSRNVYRDTPQAFSQDPMALVLAQEAVAFGRVEFAQSRRREAFCCFPICTVSRRQIHAAAEALYKGLCSSENYDFELRHKAIIDRFGRYPHRNEILGRNSTTEEVAFLTQPGSRF